MSAVEFAAVRCEADVSAAVDAACRKVAPSWPLDRFIAVNPYWGHVGTPFDSVAARLPLIAGTRLRMPNSYYRAAWSSGVIDAASLREALEELDSGMAEQEAVAALAQDEADPPGLPLLSDILDSARDLRREPAWSDTITHAVSQFCAAHFDAGQADWQVPRRDGLFASWRKSMSRDLGPVRLMHAPELSLRAARLPADAHEAIRDAAERLGVSRDRLDDLLEVALLRIGGWAAWCAYLRWQARLEGDDDTNIVELLAIRLAWECLLDDGLRDADSAWSRWQRAWQRAARPSTPPGTTAGAVWQRALEIAYQRPLARALAAGRPVAPDNCVARVVFCIDIRSEVFRRALEAADPAIRTSGFAGFFGLPIRYTPLGTAAARPQLPGLLAPQLDAGDSSGSAERDQTLARKRRARLRAAESWGRLQRMPGSAFTFVESLGIGYLARLVRRSLPGTGRPREPHLAGLSAAEQRELSPQLQLAGVDSIPRRAALAERVLRAMDLTEGFPRLVALVGHGSRSANNPHAAGLDCGACCGQTGEVNARALAALLNDTAVRQTLVSRSIRIPETTHFVAAMHNTTTDDVEVFDTAQAPASHSADLQRLRTALAAAGARARAERAPRLGLGHLAGRPAALARAVRARADDWSQTRPEWGLANNAAFIVAPRRRTCGLDLGGRAFLHDYDHRRDTDGSVLELIMTAPMIVTHWINLQYYASTVDNRRYGSGNKVLHNVVGGRIGVFEGNGGDLRIGLPIQSLHDGRRWMHTPQRLSVFIEAPRRAIDAVIGKHETVRQLLDHRWLYLFRIDGEAGTVERYASGSWRAWQEGSTPTAFQDPDA